MSMEIERILALRKTLGESDKKELDFSLEVVEGGFQKLLDITKHWLFTGEKEVKDFSDELKALSVIKAYAEKAGIDFPAVNNEQDAMVCVAKYGKEIVLS